MSGIYADIRQNSTNGPYNSTGCYDIIVLYRQKMPTGQTDKGGVRMEITNAQVQSISSIRRAIGIETLKRSLNQDAQSMTVLLRGFQATNAKVMESSVTPHKGGNIDIRV